MTMKKLLSILAISLTLGLSAFAGGGKDDYYGGKGGKGDYFPPQQQTAPVVVDNADEEGLPTEVVVAIISGIFAVLVAVVSVKYGRKK